jgi:hypothetical protein
LYFFFFLLGFLASGGLRSSTRRDEGGV